MNLTSFKCKFLNPCKKALHLFKFRLHKPIFIRALRRKPKTTRKTTTTQHEGRLPKFLTVLHSLRRQSRETDQITDLKSFSDVGHQKAPHSSPITPAYIRLSGADIKQDVSDRDEVEDACRSFENYLVEMIVEEGKMRDLVDVEEVLYCWKNLKSPLFTDLVCRFYGELCKDLFSNVSENYRDTSGPLLG